MGNLVAVAALETPALPTSSEMWTTVTTGASNFVTGVVTPAMNLIGSNAICLMFLSVSFTFLGIKAVRRVVGALGRGR